MHRKTFLQRAALAAASYPLSSIPWMPQNADAIVMTVNGPMKPEDLHFTLTHEHVLADFIGADNYSKERYNAEEVYTTALPFLEQVKKKAVPHLWIAHPLTWAGMSNYFSDCRRRVD